MTTTLRAALSVVMLLGFYGFAFGIVGALAFATYLLGRDHMGPAAAKLAWVTIAIAVAILAALWRVARTKPVPPPGLPVTRDRAPALWGLVQELAATAQTRVPDEILLIPVVNAAVVEETRLLGLIGGRRRLYLGVPLLLALDVSQLRSVIAHELGHYSRRHTRLGAIAYRGRSVVGATVAELDGKVSGWLLLQYAKIYMMVSAAVSRRQELEADELSVLAAGRRTAQATLRELPVVDSAWRFYESTFIAPGWSAGYAPRPEEFFRGFGELLRFRTGDLAKLRAQAPPVEQSRYDSHPSVAVRVAAMESLPSAAEPATDPRPATDLIADFDQAATAVAASSLDLAGREQLPWAQFGAVGEVSEAQRVADTIYRAAARFTGVPGAGLDEVLVLIEQGRLGEFAPEFFPDTPRADVPARFAEILTILLQVAAARSGVATWVRPWVGQATLQRSDGDPLDLGDIPELAVDPATVGLARARLAALGIDVSAAVMVEAKATAHGGEVINGMANVKFAQKMHDLLILDVGLILLPAPKSTDGGKRRLIAAIESMPVEELAKRHTFISLEEIARVVVTKRTPVRVELHLKDGQTLTIAETWSGERLTMQADDALLGVLEELIVQPAKAG